MEYAIVDIQDLLDMPDEQRVRAIQESDFFKEVSKLIEAAYAKKLLEDDKAH